MARKRHVISRDDDDVVVGTVSGLVPQVQCTRRMQMFRHRHVTSRDDEQTDGVTSLLGHVSGLVPQVQCTRRMQMFRHRQTHKTDRQTDRLPNGTPHPASLPSLSLACLSDTDTRQTDCQMVHPPGLSSLSLAPIAYYSDCYCYSDIVVLILPSLTLTHSQSGSQSVVVEVQVVVHHHVRHTGHP
jgi:hypothetical protein